ncbi:hypothetical protein LJC26_06075 [Desulfovibrio sp. OttesenSCG-928-O18]|nr:hypothetical protein [Desulfovibrio sp. OttesenSCG-928-O18]
MVISWKGVTRKLLSAALLGAALCAAGCFDSGEEVTDDLVDARKAMMQRDFLEAEKSFERYLRRSPDGEERWEVWNNLTELALSVRNDRKAAVELLEAMLIEYADVPVRKREISVRLAELYRLSRKYERAVFLWSSVAEDPKADNVERARACRNLAHVYLRRLEFELAKESLGYCLALDIPDTVRAECLYDLAQTFMGMDELDNAIVQLRAVLALRNISQAARTLTIFMLADALDQKGKNDEAMELFTSISETYPNRKVVEQRIEFLEKKKKPPVPPVPGKK